MTVHEGSKRLSNAAMLCPQAWVPLFGFLPNPELWARSQSYPRSSCRQEKHTIHLFPANLPLDGEILVEGMQ